MINRFSSYLQHKSVPYRTLEKLPFRYFRKNIFLQNQRHAPSLSIPFPVPPTPHPKTTWSQSWLGMGQLYSRRPEPRLRLCSFGSPLLVYIPAHLQSWDQACEQSSENKNELRQVPTLHSGSSPSDRKLRVNLQ